MHTFGKGQCKTPAEAATPAEALWRDSSGIFIKRMPLIWQTSKQSLEAFVNTIKIKPGYLKNSWRKTMHRKLSYLF